MGAYFETLMKLTLAYLFLFVCWMPVMGIYSSVGGIVDDSYGFITQFSLGNMGGATYKCNDYPANKDNLTISCDVGVFDATQMNITNMGII